MLRSAQRLVVPQASLLQQACLYSSKAEPDYADLVIKATSDIAKVEPTPDKEIGMCAGVPLETYKRKVSFGSSAASSDSSRGRTAGAEHQERCRHGSKSNIDLLCFYAKCSGRCCTGNRCNGAAAVAAVDSHT